MLRPLRALALLASASFVLSLVGCGGEGGDTSFPTFSVDPSNSVVSGIGERDGEASVSTTGVTRLEFGDSARSLVISVPAGRTLPTTLTFGSTSGLSARVATSALGSNVAWTADSGTVRLSRNDGEIVAALDAGFVPDPSGNVAASTAISSGFRMRGTGTTGSVSTPSLR